MLTNTAVLSQAGKFNTTATSNATYKISLNLEYKSCKRKVLKFFHRHIYTELKFIEIKVKFELREAYHR